MTRFIRAFAKYAVVLASGLAIGFYMHEPPNLEKFVTLPSLDEIDIIFREALAAAKPKALVAPVDPAAAARVGEELDYRIAQRTNSLQGWRAFLAAHENGLFAQDARAEVDTLLATETPPVKAAAEATRSALLAEGPEAAKETNAAAPVEAKSELASADRLSAGMQVASLDPDDNYRRGAERFPERSKRPADAESDGSVVEQGCHPFQPEVLRPVDRSGPATTPTTVAETSKAAPDQNAAPENEGVADRPPAAQAATLPHGEIDPDGLNGLCCKSDAASPSVPAKPSPASARKRGAASSSSKARASASSHSSEPSQRADHCSRSVCNLRHPELPPILMALLGEKPRHSSSFGRIKPTDRPSAARGR